MLIVKKIEKKSLRCKICLKKYNHRSSLSRHHLKHEKDSTSVVKHFQCPKCEKSFTQKCNLIRHEKGACKFKEVEVSLKTASWQELRSPLTKVIDAQDRTHNHLLCKCDQRKHLLIQDRNQIYYILCEGQVFANDQSIVEISQLLQSPSKQTPISEISHYENPQKLKSAIRQEYKHLVNEIIYGQDLCSQFTCANGKSCKGCKSR